jgi:hypothetical protein
LEFLQNSLANGRRRWIGNAVPGGTTVATMELALHVGGSRCEGSKCGHQFCRTRTGEWLCWRGPEVTSNTNPSFRKRRRNTLTHPQLTESKKGRGDWMGHDTGTGWPPSEMLLKSNCPCSWGSASQPGQSVSQ